MAKRGGNLVRTLGRLETLYHMYYKHDTGNYVQMVQLRCVQRVRLSEVSKAMEYLYLQHPLLRMFIRETKRPANLQYVEMNPLKIDCRVSLLPADILLQEEFNTKFNPNGPLWRITVQNLHNAAQENDDTCTCVGSQKHSNAFRHEFSFAVTFHHSLVDGVYLMYLIADFVELLDKIQRNQTKTGDIQRRNMPSPLEQYVHPILWTGKSVITPSLSTSVTSLQALTAYKQCFSQEIDRLRSNPVQANSMATKLERKKTKQFLSDCKLQGILVSGAIGAASCIAFTKQLKLELYSQVKVLEIPVEIMVDMRRYASSVEDYAMFPGAAAMHLPFLVEIPLCEKLDSKELFWQIARKISDDLSNAIQSTEAIKFMVDEVKRTINSKIEDGVGKSPYVITIANLYNVDNIVRAEQKPRFQLGGFQVLTQIDIDHHPIFEVHGFTLSGEFHFNVSYCGRYTSKETADRFSLDMTQVIQSTVI
jgi:hypothetical protein